MGGTAAEDFFVNGFLQDVSAAAVVEGGGAGAGGTSSSSSSQPEEKKVEERLAAATDAVIIPRERCSSQLAMEQWRTFLEQQQQNATTSSCQPGKPNHLSLGFAQGLRKKERKNESSLLS